MVCVFSFSSSFLGCYILVGNVSCFKIFSMSSQVHRRKVRVWQMICILSHFVEDDIVGKVTSDLHICLYVSLSLMCIRIISEYISFFYIEIFGSILSISFLYFVQSIKIASLAYIDELHANLFFVLPMVLYITIIYV